MYKKPYSIHPVNMSLRTLPHRLGLLLGLIVFSASCVVTIGASRNPITAPSQNADAGLQILFADSFGAVLRTDMTSAQLTIVAAGQRLVQPFGIATGHKGEVYVSDTGAYAIFRIDPTTGAQNIISSGGILGVPFGIAVEQTGNILVVNGQALLRIDPRAGLQRVVSSQGFFAAPLGVAVAVNGDILVVDAYRKIIQVNSQTGAQRLISQDGLLKTPQGIAINGGNVYVTDVATPDGNFGIGRIIRVDLSTGTQTILSEGGYLVGPVGIAVAPNGEIIVGDPYTINLESVNLFDGGIVGIDPLSGVQSLLARGQGNFVNPRGVALIPSR